MRILKPSVFLACLIPFVLLLINAVSDQLGANPLEEIRDTTGIWTLRLLIVTLAITPIRYLTGWHRLIRFRRMIGLFAFFYAALHFITYVWLDQFFAFGGMLDDLTKRRFIMARLRQLCLTDSARSHLNGGLDPAFGWEALANDSPPDLHRRGGRRGSLCVAGETGY